MGKTKAHSSRYKLKDGKFAKSVTTVINSNLGWNKNVLIGWARKQALMGNDPTLVLNEAASIGTLTHYLVECEIKKETPDTDDYTKSQIEKATNGYNGFLDWQKAYKPKYIGIELRLLDEKNGIGGTADMFAELDGALCIGDLKTSKFLYDEHLIQLGCYAHMYESIQPKAKVKSGFVLRVDKENGSFTHHHISRKQLDWGWGVFQCLMELEDLKKKK